MWAAFFARAGGSTKMSKKHEKYEARCGGGAIDREGENVPLRALEQ